MATQTIQYDINVNPGNSVKTLGKLEEELAQINEELKDVDVNSQAFEDLSKRSQDATRELEKVNSSIEGIRGEDKIQALDGSLKVLGGTVQGVVGGLGLLGVESESFGKFEEKAASAIALGIGIKDVGEGVGQLAKFTKKLPGPTKAAAAAQKVFNFVLSMNPIGLIVIAITAVVAGFLLFSDKARDLIKKIKPLNTILEKTVGFFKMLGRSLGLVATEEEELAEATRKATDSRVKDLEREIKVRKAAGEDTVALEREKLQKLIALTEEGTEEQKNALNDLAVFEAGLLKKKQDDIDKANQIAADKRKAEKEKRDAEAEANAKEAKDKEDARLDNIAKIVDEYKKKEEDILADTEIKKLELEEERKLAELERLNATEAEKQAIREFYAARKKEQEGINDEELKVKTEENAQAAIDALYENIETEFQLEQDRIAMKQFAVDSVLGLVNQETAIGKAALIAKQILSAKSLVVEAKAALSSINLSAAKASADTSTGFAATLKAGFPQNVPLLIAYAAQAASIIGAITKAVGGAKSAVSGVSGVSGGGVQVAAPQPALTPTVSTPTEQQLGVADATQSQQPPVRAYVIAGNVTSAQEADARITQRRVVGRN